MKSIAKDIPLYLHPIINGLRARLEHEPEAAGYGVIDAMPRSLTAPDNIELGIGHGMGHYSVYSVSVNTKLFGDDCCVVSFRNAMTDRFSDKFEAAKAYFNVHEQTDKIVEDVWNYLVGSDYPDDAAKAPFVFSTGMKVVEARITATTAQMCALTKSMSDDIKSGKLDVDFGDFRPKEMKKQYVGMGLSLKDPESK